MFKLPDLDYPFDALEPYIDKRTVKIHHGKHHQTYTDRLNDAIGEHDNLLSLKIEDIFKNTSIIPSDIRIKVINNAGGYYNHNLYWKFLNPKHTEPSGMLLKMLEAGYGNIDVFKEKFSNAALNHFGSGWGWLVVNSNKLEIVSTPNQNTPLSEGLTPILGIDVWEHAYYIKYQNRRIDYINAWWNIVNWNFVSILFEKLQNGENP